ncbi:MAG: 3-dehydroquinate synthase [Spirochaetales bacterium]|nr:3-dehydroquinate synthase [Spirochaetales bacterium]
MDRALDVCLQDGKRTKVLIAKDIKDLSLHLSGYGRNVMWVFDRNSAALFTELPEQRVVLEAGEIHKSWKSIELILSAAVNYGLARDSIFIGFGGGVVCDMTALASSLYMRGARLVLVPTTLLCMVDASVGGKTAIDFANAKNLIGSFYPAEEVLICTDTLRTLPENEYLCGLGEVVKHSFLTKSTELYDFMMANRDPILHRNRELVAEMVRMSIQVKADFIEKDPTEQKGIRSFLNLGHTFAHALESSGNFASFSHGKAVAWGCSRALELGVLMGITDRAFADRCNKILRAYRFDIDYRIGRGDWLSFYQALAKDKKKLGGHVKFVLLQDQGEPLLTVVDPKLIQSVVIASYR